MAYIQSKDGAVEIKTFGGVQYAFGVGRVSVATAATILRETGYAVKGYVKVMGRLGWKVEKAVKVVYGISNNPRRIVA